jgi:hypothetical protein
MKAAYLSSAFSALGTKAEKTPAIKNKRLNAQINVRISSIRFEEIAHILKRC